MIDSQTFPRMFTKFWKKKAEAESIKEKLDNRDPALLFDMTIMVSGKDKLSASENATTVESFWNKGGKNAQIALDRIFAIPHIAFLQSLPLGASQEHLETTDNYWFNFDNEVAQFVPLEADWRGNTPNFLCVSRRGMLAGINFFDSPLSKNGYIIATSGAGKSVFLQQVGFWTHAMGARVFFVDIGGSYKKICNTLKGEYIEIKTDSPICFNPFTSIRSQEELDESMPFFQDFIYMIGASKNLEESQREEKYVKAHLNDIILDLFKTLGNDLEITDIQNALKKTDDSRLKSFAQHLSPFCRGGVYSKFFSGPATVNLSNSFCVLELGSVEEQADIRDAIIFIMLYHISQTVYHTGNNEKVQVIIDEAHKFLGKNPRMDDFIDQAYRRFRKHDSSILMATQGFDDIYNPKTGGLSKAGQTIISNSPWKVFLKQTATSINMLVQSGLFSFTAMEEQVIRSIKTVKGEYSEFFLINPDEQKIPYRLILDRFFYYITTTDAEDRNRIDRVMREKDCNTEDAIEFIIQQEIQAEKA
jgi:conjugal transfer ATP-binding protein TraC